MDLARTDLEGQITQSESKAQARRWIWRPVLLFALLGAELILFTLPFNATGDVSADSSWLGLLLRAQEGVRPVFITSLLAIVLLSWPVMVEEFRQVAGSQSRWNREGVSWVVTHLCLASLLVVGTEFRGAILPSSTVGNQIVWLLWAALAFGALGSLSLAALPAHFWFAWISRSRRVFAGGVAFGSIAYLLAGYSQALWGSLQRSTFAMVAVLLGAAGQQQIIVEPQKFVIGTQNFTVRVSPQCSGSEGIGLICAVLVVYFWFYRREIRFPQAFLLLPVGIVAIWILNALRIAALIIIGGSNSEAAIKGFHSVAGWLSFNLVACGLIWISSRSGFFAKERAISGRRSAAAPYLMPLIVIIAPSMITRILSPELDTWYPVRVIGVGLALWYYREKLTSLLRKPSLASVLAGALTFALWIALAPGQLGGDAGTAEALAGMSRVGALVWLAFRVIGSVITVPIAEELAFRGYLLRKLVDSDFENVSFGQFTWLSFLASSLLFGALHRSWVAGFVAGMIFASAMYRRGELADAVGAHMTSNAMLSAYVLLFHRWLLWS